MAHGVQAVIVLVTIEFFIELWCKYTTNVLRQWTDFLFLVVEA